MERETPGQRPRPNYGHPHPGGLDPIAVSTAPYPGFATDWQPPLVAALTQAQGVSAVHETVFEDRLGYAHQLSRMGATIQTFNDCLGGGDCRFAAGRHRHSALVAGPTKIHGAEVAMEGIRAGFGLAVAAVMATGDSLLSGVLWVPKTVSWLVRRHFGTR